MNETKYPEDKQEIFSVIVIIVMIELQVIAI